MSTLRADAQPSLAVVGLQLASGLALTYPLQAADAVFKTNYQPLRGSNGGGAHYENTLQAAQALVRRDGYLGLLRGVAPHFAWTVLYSSGFESFYQIYRRLPIDKTPLGFVAAQDFALAAWRAVLSPLTTIVTRLVVRPSAYAELGARDGGGALATVGLGDPRALWRAATDASERRAPWTLFKPSVAALELVAALTGTVANSLVSVPLTEILVALVGTGPRRGLARLGADEWKGIATLASVAAAGVAVRFANVAVETVSKRLQAQHGADDADDAFSAAGGALKNAASSAGGAASASAVSVPRPKPYAGALDAFATIVDEEGWQGLFHGWGVQLGGTAAVAAATVGLARYNGRV